MTACTCPLAGWCERHQVVKHKTWHKLCQSHAKYRAAWDEGRGPGQARAPLTPAQLAKKEKIRQRVERQQRLLSWLSFWRHPGDRGAGDAAQRLFSQATVKSEAAEVLDSLLRQCSCSREDAVTRLNTEHPYPANTRNLGGS